VYDTHIPPYDAIHSVTRLDSLFTPFLGSKQSIQLTLNTGCFGRFSPSSPACQGHAPGPRLPSASLLSATKSLALGNAAQKAPARGAQGESHA
jgi:hypothetical protein